jgi:hypothetical protein
MMKAISLAIFAIPYLEIEGRSSSAMPSSSHSGSNVL